MSCGRSDHYVLLIGPPGAGTAMLARRLTTIRPATVLAEALETTRIHRVAGLTGERVSRACWRPSASGRDRRGGHCGYTRLAAPGAAPRQAPHRSTGSGPKAWLPGH